MIQLLSRLDFVVAVELHVDADLGVFVERRQRSERGRLLTLTTQDIQGACIEIFDGSRVGQDGTHKIGEGHGLVFAVKEAAHAPNDRRRRLQGNLELGDDAECATRTDKQIDGIHIVSDEIARSIFGLGHGVVGKVELERAALHRDERKATTLCKNLAAVKLEQVAIGQHDMKARDVRAHGAVSVATGAGSVACRHAAQAGRCLGGIGRKELLGGFLELLVGLKRCLVPAGSRQHFLAQLLAQLRQHDAGRHTQKKAALLIAANAR